MDFYETLLAKKLGGGGGSSVDIEQLSVTQNGTYTAEEGTAYSPVVVEVPQTTVESLSVTQNGTYSEQGKAYSPVVVDVPEYDLFDATKPTGDITTDVTQITENYVASRTGITGIYAPYCEFVGQSKMSWCLSVKTIEMPALTEYGQGAFDTCRECTRFIAHNVHKAGINGLSKVKANIAFPNITVELAMMAFRNWYGQKADLGGSALQLNGQAFENADKLTDLILRNNTIVPLANTSCFNGSTLKSGGTGATIYIPESLYNHLGDGTSSDYKAATNWATIDGYGTITWAKIEGSYYETHYADDTLIPTT